MQEIREIRVRYAQTLTAIIRYTADAAEIPEDMQDQYHQDCDTLYSDREKLDDQYRDALEGFIDPEIRPYITQETRQRLYHEACLTAKNSAEPVKFLKEIETEYRRLAEIVCRAVELALRIKG